LVGKTERGNVIGRPRHRWEDNIKIDFKERGLEYSGQNLLSQ
jgi:hypothetical protein